MSRVSRVLLVSCFLGVAAGVVPSAADASTIIFTNDPIMHPGGTIVIGDESLELATITGGRIDTVGIIGGPAFVVTGPCGGHGCLDLTTGPLLSGNGDDYLKEFSYFDFGSSLTITGTTSAGAGTLFAGTFSSLIEVVMNVTAKTGSLQGTLAPGFLNPGLASALGVSEFTDGGAGNSLFFQIKFSESQPYEGTATANDFQVESASVPEPASLVLLSVGLWGLGTMLRRRQTY